MCKIQRMEKMILQFKGNISELRKELESGNADKRARASDAITYARHQINEAKKVIEEENGKSNCQHNCEACKNSSNILLEKG